MIEINHQCAEMDDAEHSEFGKAIESIYYADANLFAETEAKWQASSENGEYETAIKYCPFCGSLLCSIVITAD